MIGKRNSGKSKVSELFKNIIFAKALTSSIELTDLGTNFMDGNLVNSILNVSADVGEERLNAKIVRKIKGYTGGDTSSPNIKYQQPSEMKPFFNLLAGTNSLIRTLKFDPAFDARVMYLPFLFSPKDEDIDTNLLPKFAKEAEGIVMKALSRFPTIIKNNLVLDAQYTREIAEREFGNIKGEMKASLDDEIVQLINEDCLVTKNPTDKLSTKELYERFGGESSGISIKSFSSTFYRVSGLEQCRKGDLRCVRGIKFKSSFEALNSKN